MAKNFPELRAQINETSKQLAGKIPQTVSAFGQLHKNALANGALATKHKELISLAISIAIRCDGCIAFHVHDALKAGATRQEIEEAIGVAISMGGGPGMVYACEAFEALNQFEGKAG